MEEAIKKGGFSWLGFFFGPAYFSGYGKLRAGLVMAIASGIPMLG